ncbi:hypothetical protein I4U23_000105 [Adineta vaga]|nr:hypothetical protein I4U23_000105 [Adineta vaga]
MKYCDSLFDCVACEKGPFVPATKKHDEVCDAQISLLQKAAQLEHSLLNAYLYTASTIKTTPHEFEKLAGVGDNRRAAIQFERARAWKESILLVAREEMLHLHYVQCMLRGLGERPHFALPKRHLTTGNWLFPNWRAATGETQVNDDIDVPIPIAPFTLDNIRRFVLYDSSDTLQGNEIFTSKACS